MPGIDVLEQANDLRIALLRQQDSASPNRVWWSGMSSTQLRPAASAASRSPRRNEISYSRLQARTSFGCAVSTRVNHRVATPSRSRSCNVFRTSPRSAKSVGIAAAARAGVNVDVISAINRCGSTVARRAAAYSIVAWSAWPPRNNRRAAIRCRSGCVGWRRIAWLSRRIDRASPVRVSSSAATA